VYLHENKDIEIDEIFGRSVYLCNDCKRCETYCIYKDKNVQINNRYSKELIFKAGFAPKKIYEIEKNLINTHNIFGMENTIEKNNLYSKQYDIFIYLGDFVRFLEPGIFTSLEKLLKNLNINYIYDSNEVSDGIIALDLGMEKISKELMRLNFNRINKYSFKKLIILDPYSYKNFKEDYKKYGFVFDCEILHYSEYIEELINKIRVFKTEDKIKYFDPCRLGRGMKIYESPRNILTGLFNADNINFFKNKEESECCGGYISLYDENLARLISSNVIEDFINSGYDADVLITACPLCLNNLKCANENNRIKIYDILEYISLNLEIKK